MTLTLLSNEFHHVQCILYRLNNASQSSRWLLVEDFGLWMLLGNVVAWWPVRCWLEPGRGSRQQLGGEWPLARPHGPICHLVSTELITGSGHSGDHTPAISRDPGHQLTIIVTSKTHWVLSLLGLRGSWPSLQDGEESGDIMTRSFHSGPSPSNLSARAVITVFTRHCWF